MTRPLTVLVALLALTLAAPLAPPALASQEIALSAEQTVELRKINTYLNALNTMRGRFTQLGPSGEFTEGTFYLQRPGKIRFEYSPPNPILVIADGFWVGIEDRKLKDTQKYPLSATPLSLLLEKHVDIAKEARIVGFEEQGGDTMVTLESKSLTTPGRLTLIMGGPNFALKQWIVVDAQGLRTEVSLFDLVADVQIDPKLFWINDNTLVKIDYQ
jgi:outer membrane lipoprotein-sorting protein